MARIVLGNREGTLAVRHGRGVMEALSEEWPDLHVSVRTLQGGEGSSPLLDALAKGNIDVAVVQLDTLPPHLPDELTLAAVCRRPEARSALVAKGSSSLDKLPQGAVVGVFSARDEAFLRAARPGVQTRLLAGTPEQRLALVASGELAAIVMPAAALIALDLRDHLSALLDVEAFTPAPGQGAVGLVVRADDDLAFESIYPLQHRPSFDRVRAERAFAAAVGELPVGASATVTDDGDLTLVGAVVKNDTTLQASVSGEAREADELGRELASDVMERLARI
jgi:hydroxymethylbilane synthase